MRIRRKIQNFKVWLKQSTFVGVFLALVAYEIVCHLIY
jgi:hypothetical protein